jgi:hypothetical protein
LESLFNFQIALFYHSSGLLKQNEPRDIRLCFPKAPWFHRGGGWSEQKNYLLAKNPENSLDNGSLHFNADKRFNVYKRFLSERFSAQ